MYNLQLHDITALFVCIDDLVVSDERKVGRKSVLSQSEMLTILIFGTLLLQTKRLKSIYQLIQHHYKDCFPVLPDYSNFVRHSHRLIPKLIEVLSQSLDTGVNIGFADSTMLPVCKPVRADRHKVAQGVAAFGKNHQGWHYGFKLHAMVNDRGQFCSFYFTPANVYDAQVIPRLITNELKILVGDSHYGARVMRERIWKEHRVIIIAPPHHTQKKRIATWWQNLLLSMRPKVESAFGILKEHFSLVSSFPRSISGYFLHYTRVLLAYQFSRTFK